MKLGQWDDVVELAVGLSNMDEGSTFLWPNEAPYVPGVGFPGLHASLSKGGWLLRAAPPISSPAFKSEQPHDRLSLHFTHRPQPPCSTSRTAPPAGSQKKRLAKW